MNSKNSPFRIEAGNPALKYDVPTSKSYANRLLLLAAIDKRSVELEDLPESTDVKNMLKAFEIIGLDVERNGKNVTIKNSFPECEKKSDDPVVIHSGDGGTTNRFLISLLGRGKNEYQVEAEGKMRERPMDELARCLRELNVKVIRNDKVWFSVQGPAQDCSKIDVDCLETTQFITGLKLSYADYSVSFNPINLESSIAYLEMSDFLLQGFKNQTVSYRVPIDFSGLGYPIAYGLTIGDVVVTNGHCADKFQADSEFLAIAEQMGASIDYSEGIKIALPKNLKGINVDGSKFPDLIPTLAYVCSYASEKSVLTNLGVLRHKESDRVEETLRLLKTFEVPHSYDNAKEELVIEGNAPKCGEKDSLPPADHRMVMVAYLFLRKNSGGTLINEIHVAKSFPNYFEVMGVK